MLDNSVFRILVIDDNVAIHSDFIKILSTNSSNTAELDILQQEVLGKVTKDKSALPNFQIDTASQGQEGVDKIRVAIAESRPYALAFVDIRMPPGWDGIETIKHIWELSPDMQIVICTAYSDYSWEETVEQLGARENLLILKKPFDTVAVRQLACALTKKWQLLQESKEYTLSLEQRVKERTASLHQSLTISRGTLESSTDGILVIDSKNKIIDFNQKVLEIWKIPNVITERKDGNLFLEYVGEQIVKAETFEKLIQTLSFNADSTSNEFLQTKDGRYIEHYSQPYKLQNEVSGRVWSFRDVTKRVQMEEKLQYIATHDALTDLPNRVLLFDRINQLIAISEREPLIFGLLFFDIDRFKLINDSLNHLVGDELLKAIAQRIWDAIREEDTLTRLGGDEFVLLAPLHKNVNDIAQIAKKIIDAFQTPFLVSGREIHVTTSIGISIFPTDGITTETLLRNADIAMYRAKELGGNQFHLYTNSLNDINAGRLKIETDLRHAIINDEFFLEYQPEYAIETKQIKSVEALIRWRHPESGTLVPIDFIPIAEKSGLIIQITDWVLRTACLQNLAWQKQGLQHIRITVNIPSLYFKLPNLVENIQKHLKDTGLKAEFLELELTENVIINGIENINAINELKKMGVRITLDDFGTGYSCLNYLRKIHVDTVKIDQSFIQNIDVNKGDEVIIQAIITMANNLNLGVVAEGVETKSQLSFLTSNHCGEVQGYYLSKPISTEALENLLRNPSATS